MSSYGHTRNSGSSLGAIATYILRHALPSTYINHPRIVY